MMGAMKFLVGLFSATRMRRDLRALNEDRRILVDQVRQIEWRLAMCRNMAVDINIAHNLASTALEGRGGPFPDTSANYQRWKAERRKGYEVAS